MSAMTFSELTKDLPRHQVESLAWHLAMMRARETVQELLARDTADRGEAEVGEANAAIRAFMQDEPPRKAPPA